MMARIFLIDAFMCFPANAYLRLEGSTTRVHIKLLRRSHSKTGVSEKLFPGKSSVSFQDLRASVVM